MRLDAFLVEQSLVTSRGRAKRAIISGKVSVDGTIVFKPSTWIGYNNDIKIMEDIDVPAGYLKLKAIQQQTQLIHPGDTVLDLGSSAGGFIIFASEIGSNIIGIEFSDEFMPSLEKLAELHDNVQVMKGDIFNIPLNSLSDRPVDVILNDITVEPEDSIKVLERVLPLLKPGGRILQVLKLGDGSGLDEHIERMEGIGVSIQHIIKPDKREVYVVAVRNGENEAKE
ncbi:MAG: methyltransferase domain-containing protein [ANME-2 cluster archaeon]|nr:methyltransferase domain-containing protein [ANME-2 cluster archaeon]